MRMRSFALCRGQSGHILGCFVLGEWYLELLPIQNLRDCQLTESEVSQIYKLIPKSGLVLEGRDVRFSVSTV
jgi:hypothetical protein